jgi:hypothetical protein
VEGLLPRDDSEVTTSDIINLEIFMALAALNSSSVNSKSAAGNDFRGLRYEVEAPQV